MFFNVKNFIEQLYLLFRGFQQIVFGVEVLKTSPSEYYVFNEVTGTSLHFKVMAESGAHICLSSSNYQETASMYEILLGDAKNTKSSVRRVFVSPDGVKNQIQQSELTPQLLSPSEFKAFWITWDGGFVKFGRENSTHAILEFKDPDPITITHYGYRTLLRSGEWQFVIKENVIDTNKESIRITTSMSSEYQFYPANDTTMYVNVKAKQDAYVLLVESAIQDEPPFCEIRIGKGNNKRSLISCEYMKKETAQLQSTMLDLPTASILSIEEFRSFLITWDNPGQVQLFQIKDGAKENLISIDNIQPFVIKFFGIRIGSGTAEWIIQSVNTGEQAQTAITVPETTVTNAVVATTTITRAAVASVTVTSTTVTKAVAASATVTNAAVASTTVTRAAVASATVTNAAVASTITRAAVASETVTSATVTSATVTNATVAKTRISMKTSLEDIALIVNNITNVIKEYAMKSLDLKIPNKNITKKDNNDTNVEVLAEKLLKVIKTIRELFATDPRKFLDAKEKTDTKKLLTLVEKIISYFETDEENQCNNVVLKRSQESLNEDITETIDTVLKHFYNNSEKALQATGSVPISNLAKIQKLISSAQEDIASSTTQKTIKITTVSKSAKKAANDDDEDED